MPARDLKYTEDGRLADRSDNGVGVRAAEQGIDIENAAQNILTSIAVADTVMSIGFRAIVDGKIKPTVKETLEAAKLSREFSKDDEGSLDVATMQLQVGLILQAVKEITSEEQWGKISRRVLELRDENVEDAVIVDD